MDNRCGKCGRKRTGSRHKWCKRCLVRSHAHCSTYYKSRKMKTTTLGICYRCLEPTTRTNVVCYNCCRTAWQKLKEKKESPDNDSKPARLQQ